MKTRTNTLLAAAALSATAIAGSANAAIIIDGNDLGTTVTMDNGANNAIRLELNSGTASVNAAGDVLTSEATAGGFIGQVAASTLTINDGSYVANRQMIIGNGGGGNGTVTVNGGVADFNGNLWLGRDGATGLLEIAGGTVDVAGGLDLDILGGNGTINFTSGSTGTLTVAGADATSYEALYTSGDLTATGFAFGADAFGDVFEVNGETISVVPEPGSLALLGLGGLMMAKRRRRA